jgi:hypothetical protein
MYRNLFTWSWLPGTGTPSPGPDYQVQEPRHLVLITRYRNFFSWSGLPGTGTSSPGPDYQVQELLHLVLNTRNFFTWSRLQGTENFHLALNIRWESLHLVLFTVPGLKTCSRQTGLGPYFTKYTRNRRFPNLVLVTRNKNVPIQEQRLHTWCSVPGLRKILFNSNSVGLKIRSHLLAKTMFYPCFRPPWFFFPADLKSFLSHLLNIFSYNMVFNSCFEEKSNVVKLG